MTLQPEYGERLGDSAYWGPYIAQALRVAGLPSDRIAAPPVVGSFPTFLAGEVVVKLFGDAFGGGSSATVELAMHRLLAAHPAIPAPRLVGHGSLFDADDGWSWPYLITERLDGVAIRELTSPPVAMEGVAEQLGRAVHRLHRLTPPSAVLDRNLLPVLRANASSRLAGFGLPADLVDQVDDYLEDASDDRVVVHADLTADHVFIRGGEIDGVIDWGDALVADPYYELVAVYFDCLGFDRGLLVRFLEAAEWRRDSDFPRRALQAVLEFQFNAIVSLREQVDLDGVRDLDQLADRIFG